MKKVKKTALIVDSTDNIRSAMARMLAEMDFSVVYQAVSVKEATRILTERHVDLIISDWVLPDEGGKTLLLQIRNNPETKFIPFVVCSSVADQLTVIDAIKAGVSEYLAKPFSFKMFKGRVERAFSKPLNERFGDRLDLLAKKAEEERVEKSESIANAPVMSATTQHSVLIVDDEVNNIEVANQCVRQFAKVKFALNGQRAIEICKKSPPDLILLDIMMPEMDGYQTLETLKGDPVLADIPVIFVTAKAQPSDVARGLALGAADYVTKPINFPVLEMRIKNQLKVIDNIRLRDNSLNRIIYELEQRENIERILLNYVHHPLAKMGESIDRIRHRSLTSTQLATEAEALQYSKASMERVFLTLSTSMRLEDKNFIPDLTVVNLHDIVSSTIQSLQRDQLNRSLQVDNFVSHSTEVKGEEILLTTMFTALHLNAIEAAPRGSKVSFFESTSNPRFVEVTIYNPGAVPVEIREQFFDKYVSKGKVNGVGLGTYTAKLVCQTLGGDIALEANDKETRVIIKLPKA
ncbi:hypothetical protein tloyanaT_00040 [Thalassotalea loyana]|uniref:Response regulator n=1 Tax=Thalassotalea loyana TaxID=280483 RepID=A0ABQ6H7Z1_9GAMM|nr:response regulator [Thalassotalea loyana]GLX83752.1 hypothetical protein tloyanaT_00040 [Thalassotalea loyana]